MHHWSTLTRHLKTFWQFPYPCGNDGEHTFVQRRGSFLNCKTEPKANIDNFQVIMYIGYYV